MDFESHIDSFQLLKSLNVAKKSIFPQNKKIILHRISL